MKTQFTPGPWTLSIDEKKVGTISGETRGWGEDHLVTGLSLGAGNGGFSEELKANAHLIAASPEMYDSLQDLLKLVQNDASSRPIEEQDKIALARLRLAKARGES